MTESQPTPPILPDGERSGRPNRLRIFLILAIAALLVIGAIDSLNSERMFLTDNCNIDGDSSICHLFEYFGGEAGFGNMGLVASFLVLLFILTIVLVSISRYLRKRGRTDDPE